MCDLCHMDECKPNKTGGLHYPHKDHSKFYSNLFPGQCGATVIWGFFQVYPHNVEEKKKELQAKEAEAKGKHHNLLLATVNTADHTTEMMEELGWKNLHHFNSKYGNYGRQLDLWVKDI